MSEFRDHARAVTTEDLSDPDLYRSGAPEDLWAKLRATSPVHRNRRAGGDFWAVLSHELITAVLKDPTTFVSERGMRLDHNPAATAAAAGKMLIITDPPRHGKIRRIINSVFTPRMVARLEQNMRVTVGCALDEALERGTCDFTEVAARLPVSVICDMLGVPRADWDFMLDRTMVAFGVNAEGVSEFAVAEAHVDILSYYEDLVARRRKDPQDDIVTALVNGTVDGVPLTDEEIFLNCDGLISGGNETTRHATVGGLLALIENPDQWARLRADPSLLPTAVQEILRYTSPAMHVLRTAARDTELAGHEVRSGDPVALWLPAGNRDEAVFTDPERFDVTRDPNPHLAFATGTHFCLGAALATTELTVMFDEIVRRVATAEPAGPVRRMRSSLIRGFESAPVALTPAQSAGRVASTS
ncbi:cytochrome P450 [Embleya sp. NBC_00896]|uniref:cytochrome P450 n=1 Tax=Embleya sp. NBC_00896 TaxID=2975961 RepID=UPI0038670868|nr:cytochrome P450 [Embleya sp. NBC_00896]